MPGASSGVAPWMASAVDTSVQALWVATSDEEQAVSMLTHGPTKPYVKEILPAATLPARPRALYGWMTPYSVTLIRL